MSVFVSFFTPFVVHSNIEHFFWGSFYHSKTFVPNHCAAIICLILTVKWILLSFCHLHTFIHFQAVFNRPKNAFLFIALSRKQNWRFFFCKIIRKDCTLPKHNQKANIIFHRQLDDIFVYCSASPWQHFTMIFNKFLPFFFVVAFLHSTVCAAVSHNNRCVHAKMSEVPNCLACKHQFCVPSFDLCSPSAIFHTL